MIFAIRQFQPVKGVHRITLYPSYEEFDENMFPDDLFNVPWDGVENCDDVNNA